MRRVSFRKGENDEGETYDGAVLEKRTAEALGEEVTSRVRVDGGERVVEKNSLLEGRKS